MAIKYHHDHPEDQYGALGDQPLDLEEFAPFEISAETFEEAWSRFQASTTGR